MVNYKEKLEINFDLSPKQIEIIERDKDTLVRALPGSGKTTILTLKIKNLLLDNPKISKICCISYTNVSVRDLEESCSKIINSELLNKVEFLTFHSFCLKYILRPFSYLYKNNKKGFRPYKTIFNYKEHGPLLVDYFIERNVSEDEIKSIKANENIFYNLKLVNGQWIPKTKNPLNCKTVIEYLNFLNINKLTDFNLINLFALFIIQENSFVTTVLNESIDWIFIDEFQDVSEIQCKIIEELSKISDGFRSSTKWFMVGDPNQSIYGFAGANPRSMYDMRKLFNSYGPDQDCEIKLEKTHRCSDEIFKFARENYNSVLSKIKNAKSIQKLDNPEIIDYLNDLEISESLVGNGGEGKVIIKSAISAVPDEIVKLKFSAQLLNEEVCCIGINRFNSIDVYKQYKQHNNSDEGGCFNLYSEIYKDYEEKYGFKFFSLFIQYLNIKYYFSHNRLKYTKALDWFIYLLELLISEKVSADISRRILINITSDSLALSSPLRESNTVFEEFKLFTERLSSSINTNLDLINSVFSSISEEDKITSLADIPEPNLGDFLQYITKSNKDQFSFEIKYIHKIKGLEYEQVIVQKIEDLPHKTNYGLHGAIFWGKEYNPSLEEIYNYIQELNKLYVMLTRPKKNLFIIKNENKICNFLQI